MLALPLHNVRLQPCPVAPNQLTPTPQGHHCASCQRTVHDFTAGTQADLVAARADSPDGRVCGQFRAGQLAPTPPGRLRPTLRRFLVALVLVYGLGLTSREAVAQVHKAPKFAPAKSEPLIKTVELADDVEEIPLDDEQQSREPQNQVFTSVEQMPQFKEGGQMGAIKFVQQNLRWPENGGMICAEGRVFIRFIVGADGQLRKFEVVKGIHPQLDAEALRVARLLDGRFVPGKQQSRAVDVYYTMPFSFFIK